MEKLRERVDQDKGLAGQVEKFENLVKTVDTTERMAAERRVESSDAWSYEDDHQRSPSSIRRRTVLSSHEM